MAQGLELLTIQNDSAEMILERMDVEVRIMGNIATTVTEMIFYNPYDRVLEGELNFPLAENQRVYRFALDINGKLREGVAVEKNQGRRAFEGVVRQNVDPALLEMTAGNNYKTRIYPIPARGSRRILLGVDEELQFSENPLYQLALQYGEIGEFNLRVEVINQAIQPIIKRSDLVNFEFKPWNQAYVAEHHATNFKTTGTLSFEIPTTLSDKVYRESLTDTDLFYLVVNPQAKSVLKKKPTSVAIIWDASHSAKNRNLQKEKEFLRSYLKEIDDVELTILRFSDEVHDTINVHITDGNASKVVAAIDTTIYDGGTNLGKLNLGHLNFDEAILFSDGITNLGQMETIEGAGPVHTICSGSVVDPALLKYIANSTGGSFVNLTNTSVWEGVHQLSSEHLQFLGASFNEKIISEVFPSHPIEIRENSSFTLSGKIKPDKEAIITLQFGTRGRVLETREIKIENSIVGVDLRRLWAHKWVDELASRPTKNRDAIVAVGKQYGLVTPHTSLIVLDRVEDYVRYEIIPPTELREAYEKMMAQKAEDRNLLDSELLDLALEDFEDRMDWWEKDRKDSMIYVPEENEGPSGQSGENGSGNVEEPLSQEVGTEAQSVEELENIEPENEIVEQSEQPETVSITTIPIDRGEYDKVVTGKVMDPEDGTGLPGVNILVKGTSRGTVSDMAGDYQIAVNNDEVLAISFVGFKSEEVEVADRNTVDIVLEYDINELSEVVVIGYGEVRKQMLTGSVVTITTELQGQAAGVNITDALPGTTVIRGNRSISLGDEPMYIVDGEMVTRSEYEDLDPDQVASMNVIKDEDASAIYGSRAADGVIVIMTKDALEDEFQLPDSITSKFFQDLVIEDWQPEEPYLDSLKKAKPQDRYALYLRLKETYTIMPSFYLSTGSYFLTQGQERLGLRILSNLSELDLENYELLKMLAQKYRQVGNYTSSIYLFEKIAEIREGEPHSLRDLALTYQAKGEYQRALDLFLEIILTDWQDDDERFPFIKSTVLGEMNNLIALHKKDLDLHKVPKDFIRPTPVDIRVVLDWNTLETDLDLWITEPNGEKCYYSNSLTVNGGRLTEDYMDGYGPEEYLIKQAMEGEYKIEVDYYDERVQKIAGPTTLQVTIFTNYGRKNQQQKSMTLQLKEEKETVQVGTFTWEER